MTRDTPTRQLNQMRRSIRRHTTEIEALQRINQKQRSDIANLRMMCLALGFVAMALAFVHIAS